MSKKLPFLAVMVVCLFVTAAASRPGDRDAGRLDFLRSHDATRAYVLDSSLSPADFFPGFVVDPPWERGLDRITVLRGVGGQLDVERGIDLSGGGGLTAFALSPDGDTAVVGRFFPANPAGPHEVAIVRGLSTATPYVAKILPHEATEPHCVAVSPDGTYALIGDTRFGPATVTVISGLPENPKVDGRIQLGIVPGYGGDVESIDFSRDGKRALVQTALFDSAFPPLRFVPRVVMQVIRDPRPGGAQVVSDPLLLPATPAIPASPPFTGMDTGVALGDSALLLDGDSAIVPVCGALDLGQPDARIFLLRGVRSGELEIVRVLGLADGVGIAPFQVAVAPDGDRAYVVNGIGTVTTVSGLSDSTFASVALASSPATYPFSAEPAVTPDGEHLIVHHPRPPISGVPPAAVSNYDADTRAPLGAPLLGPVRELVFFKDSTLRTWPSGLMDYLDLYTADLPAGIGRALSTQVGTAIDLADRGQDRAARQVLDAFRLHVENLRRKGRLTDLEAGVLDDLAALARQRLDD